uniref:Antifreeze protein n=1 Tax=Globodera pallida TaxID=36090 RepID=A0A183BHJ5_GLOPA
MAAKALMNIANADKASELDHYYLAQALLAVMAFYVCHQVDDISVINRGIEQARMTVFEAINAYNDAKTGEAVHAAVQKARAVVKQGGEAAKAAVSPAELTNEY